MFEKVNPSHPDKVADRIAGSLVDMAYARDDNPKIAVEVLVGHGKCLIIAETSVELDMREVDAAVKRITGMDIRPKYVEVPQDAYLAGNQEGKLRCGDNGIFKGMPVTAEQSRLSNMVRSLYEICPYDGKFVIDGGHVIACQSNIDCNELMSFVAPYGNRIEANPLGDWTGGMDVDSGATNRKLGSDMADSVTGGGLHGKDLSKADVSVNIFAWLIAQETGKPVEFCCAIGDEQVGGVDYAEIVETARKFIDSKGGFEAFAEWGLV